MTNKTMNELWDLMVRDLYDSNATNYTYLNTVTSHPTDVYYDKEKEALIIEIACVGADKEEIKIEKSCNNVLNIEYGKKTEDPKDASKEYYTRKISKKAFKLSYKVNSDYNIDELDAKLKNGLLTISIPKKEESKPVQFKIK